MEELIVCVAPHPGDKHGEEFRGGMDVAEEVIHCYNAGASIVHLHVRDKKGVQTADTRWFEQEITFIRAVCPMIVEGSTGGAPEHTLAQRCVSITVPGVEMASLNLGSINLHGDVYRNPFSDIRWYAQELQRRKLRPFLDCFDLSHFSSIERLRGEGLIHPPYVVGLVFGMPDALPYYDRYLDVFVRELPEQSTWFLIRHNSTGATGFMRALELGGHVRVGFEDGPFLSNGQRARCNAELVEDIVVAAKRAGRKVVGPARARELMGMISVRH